MRKIIGIVVFFLSFTCLATDTSTYLKLLKLRNSNNPKDANYTRTIMQVYHNGVSNTIVFANAAAAKNGKPLYCMPKNLTSDQSLVEKLIVEQIKLSGINDPVVLATPPEVYAILSYQRNFPCK